MAASFQLTLDTTPPQGVAVAINGGASYTNVRAVQVTPSTTDTGGPQPAGYQVKIWGDVDNTADPNVQTTEAASAWLTLAANMNVTLAAGDGVKTVNVRLRDDVWNQSAAVSTTIDLDTVAPVVTIGVNSPDVAKVSEVPGKDAAHFTFSVTAETAVSYEVCVVPNSSSTHDQGTVIGTTNGSVNMTGNGLASGTQVNCTLMGEDLAAASPGDGAKTIKVFAQDAAGNWST